MSKKNFPGFIICIRKKVIVGVVFVILAGGNTSAWSDSIAAGVITETGLPLPRFASLRPNKVNLRTGPGERYPVDWIFVQRHMPIEIVAEFGNWRKVRDWQGTEGWVHWRMLSGKRMGVVKGGVQPLRREPDSNAALTARVMEKVLARILECEGEWCRIEIGKQRGWMRRAHIWGVYGDEKLY